MRDYWQELNARGIYTEEQLDRAIKEVGVIDIGFFVTPLPTELKAVGS